MTQVVLKFVRKHGYRKMARATQPELADFTSVKPADPFAQRNVDESGAPRMVETDLGDGTFRRAPMTHDPANLEYWVYAWQFIGVYRSDGGTYELAIELNQIQAANPPPTITIDVQA